MYFPRKLTMTWVKNEYKNGLNPTELISEIIRCCGEHESYNI
jgi:allophanate hydrolase